MGGYILCQIKRASFPFYIENISTNIYSIEELCYYFYHNIYLLDDTIINEKLCDWLKDELDLHKLYRKLYKILEEERGTGDFILTVFREINYLSHEEFKKINEELTLLEQLPAAVRTKKKADYLVNNGMYVNAIRIYEAALKNAGSDGLGIQYEGEIYHNMGCAYLHMFQMEEGEKCLLKAYEDLHTKQILKHYLTACRLHLPDADWKKECEKLNADPELCKEVISRVGKEKKLVAKEKIEDENALLEKLTREYHRSTGF